jgi:hypothetical protein
MPTWLCPKCGSEEAYAGTELQQKVTGSGGGSSVGFIGNELGDSGITPMMGRSDKINVRSETVEVTVYKCKKCDTILGEKDKRYTQKELDKRAAERVRVRAAAHEEESKNDGAYFLLFCVIILLVTFTSECRFRGGSDGHHHVGFGEYTTWEYHFDKPTEVTRSKWFPWITIFILPAGFVFFLVSDRRDVIKQKRRQKRMEERKKWWKKENAKNHPIKPPCEPKKNKTFTAKNLCRCGDATARLVSENKVQILGGSSEEKEAARQWVQKNHPEYEIS